MGTEIDDLAGAATAALEGGDYRAALRFAERAVDESRSPDALRLLGGLYFMDDRPADAVVSWEQAFGELRRAGRNLDAARCAIDVAAAYGGPLGRRSVGKGWVAQARRLLEQVGPCVEWGYLELAVLACERPNIDDLIASSERALAIAAEFGDTDLEAQALADGGLGLVTAGRVGEGFGRLDASLASVTAGAVGPKASSLCFCSMLSACDRAGDVQRAEQWTSVIDGFLSRLRDRPRPLYIHCQMTYGSLLVSVGRWEEAETHLVAALGRADAPSDSHRATTASHLARLRLEQGRLAEAEALLVPFEDREISSLPLARLHARRGQLDMAAALLRRTIAELTGDALRVGPLLLQLIDVEVRRGDLTAAEQALEGLTALEESVDGEHLAIAIVRGQARVAGARGDRAEAIRQLERAKRLLAASDLQVELAEVRLEIAELLDSGTPGCDDIASAVAEARAAHACFERLGAVPGRDRAAELLRRLGDAPRRPTTDVADAASALSGLTQRECDVLGLVAEGLTNPQIAERLYISPKTAEHHVGRLLSKLGVHNRAEAAALFARASRQPVFEIGVDN